MQDPKSGEMRTTLSAPKDEPMVGSAAKQAKSLHMKASGSTNRQNTSGPSTLPKETCLSLLFIRQLQKDGNQVVHYDTNKWLSMLYKEELDEYMYQ